MIGMNLPKSLEMELEILTVILEVLATEFIH
jgi:hypothetical protein